LSTSRFGFRNLLLPPCPVEEGPLKIQLDVPRFGFRVGSGEKVLLTVCALESSEA
jgi:hypothetical protein